MTACRVFTPHERIRFGICVGAFEKKTGVKLEKRRIYHIKGTIAGVCAFEKRHFGGKTVVIVVPSAHMGVVIPGTKYDIGIISIEERRSLSVRHRLDRALVTVRKSTLQSMGIVSLERGKEVIEFRLRRISDDLRIRVFANIQPATGFVRFNADNFGGRSGDICEVTSVRKFGVREFVREFNSCKPEGARNARLKLDQESNLGIEVDGRFFPFTEYRLSRAASRLLLRTKLALYKMELRFWFDGERFETRFGVDDVAGFWTSRDGKLRFESPFDEKVVAAQRELYLQVQRLRNPVLREFERLLGKLKVVSMPAEVWGSYVFEVDKELGRFVCSRLDKLSRNEHSTRKGSFGEMIACHILSLRYREIREHPSVKFPKTPGCHKNGVDYELVSGDPKGVDLLESKWWKNVKAATSQGRKEARKRLVERKRRNSSVSIRASFVAALDWDPKNTTGNLIVARA